MGIFDKIKKNKKGEAAAAVAPAEDTAKDIGEEEEFTEPQAKPDKQKKNNPIKMVFGAIDVAQDAYRDVIEPFYTTWIKPIKDNWPHIKRRWNGLVTAISVIFFLLYVPILLFSKIAKGLSLGWDIALYTCIGVYVVAVIVMVIITIASGKSASTQASKRMRKASKIILLVVRIASLALSITAIVISGSGESTALDTILMVLAITSIIFTSLSLIFGGAVGFFKWLISPAKIRYKFSFVAFEWKQSLDEGKRNQDKKFIKAYAKNAERVALCLDNYLLPAWGKAYIDTVNADKIESVLTAIPEEDKNLYEWVIQNLFDYALTCKYIANNPCDKLDLTGDILKERAAKPQKAESKNGFFASLFSRKSSPDQTEDTQGD